MSVAEAQMARGEVRDALLTLAKADRAARDIYNNFFSRASIFFRSAKLEASADKLALTRRALSAAIRATRKIQYSSLRVHQLLDIASWLTDQKQVQGKYAGHANFGTSH